MFQKLLTFINHKKYLKNELIHSKNILDNINGYKLDYNQRLSIVCDEENTLVIAGAGSGKTLTIVGKIRYLIERKNVNSKDILCISFTNNTVNSLKNSLNKNYNYNIDIYTFHKLALNIINDKNINISMPDTLNYIVDEFFYCNFSNILINNDIKCCLKKLIITFINLFKSNNYDISYFEKIFVENSKEKNKQIRYNNYVLLKLIKEIYIIYERELKSCNMIDFNDMINYAIDKVENSNISYKYIIIDEYQDTSFVKYQLIKKIKEKCKSKIMAVGDDFQSIYRFTGCNLDIFLKFKKYYGKTKIIKIKKTYRNSKELISVAGSFIMKNPKQMIKIMHSNKSINKPIKIVYYNDLQSKFIDIIKSIDTKILILVRNNNDINKLIGNSIFKKDDSLIYKNICMRYLTVHKSKGLEEENVIVLNMNNSYLGFPNKIVNNKILDYVLTIKDSYLYEEERRLFYVALTRTKNNVYLFCNKNNPSIFIKELIKEHSNNIQIIN